MAQGMQVAPGTARGGGTRRLGLVLLFTAPALVLYTIYVLYPVGVSIWYSMLDWNGLAAGKFVGLSNWRRLFQDQSVLSSLRNTLIILVASFAVEMPVGLALAVLVQRMKRLGTILSSIYILPLLMSSVAVGITWSFLYNPQYGPLYYIYNDFGRQAPGLLGSPTLAIWSVTAVVLWQFIPLYMLLFNAGLVAIPQELYEAASIDGAGAWTRFRSITIPLLRRTFITASVLVLTGSLVYFDLIFVMTGGGPGNASYTLAMYIYRSAFQDQEVGYGSAVAVLLFVISFIVSGLIVRYSRLLQGD
ncbi:MAG TPA: sugar ABC transporter permease [Chloroflexota bacterium]|nr:sugar ABC transporter permease [Chloroflexota bacterium]